MELVAAGWNGHRRCYLATAIFASNSEGLDGWKGAEHAVLGPHSSAPLNVAVGGVGSGGIASPSRGLREPSLGSAC